jgi:ABC-type Fe3+/spermidine/putrescine transport system ATPase subunit
MTADRIVVLRKGRIEQVGTPSEIYTKPKSIFVTSFVGGANFFEGTLIRIDDLGSTIETREGYQIKVTQKGGRIGEKVVVAVRFEDIFLNSSINSKWNSFSGKVESTTFIGGSIKYEINLGNDLVVFSKVLTSNFENAIEEGETVAASFHPGRCYLFPYPKIGLLKEIEAI